MSRVTFERRQRPPPIRLGLSADSVPKYVKTPYPTQPFPQVVAVPSPSNTNPSIDGDKERERERESRIYYLAQGLPRTDLSDEISDFLHEKYPLATFHLHCSSSLLALDDHWGLCLPHPLLHSHSRGNGNGNGNGNGMNGHHDGPAELLVQAHHIYIRFVSDSSPGVREWGGVARHIRDHLLVKHEMSDAAIELASSSSSSSSSPGECGGHVFSAWYPPKLDKDKLTAFFEGSYCDDDGGSGGDSGLDLGAEAEAEGGGQDVIQGEEEEEEGVVISGSRLKPRAAAVMMKHNENPTPSPTIKTDA